MIVKRIKNIARVLLCNMFGRNIRDCEVSDVKIVAFDIFDTLIFRENVKFPTDVFDYVGKSIEIANFMNRRVQVENGLRKKRKKEGKEVSVDEIYDALKDEMKWDDSFCNMVNEKEFEHELQICHAVDEVWSFYNELLNDGRKIVIISDMYLDKEHLKKILINSGYNIDEVAMFISSEYGCTKRNGGLYGRVLKEMKVNPDEMMMIGDNWISDYLIPKRLGIRATLYKRNV